MTTLRTAAEQVTIRTRILRVLTLLLGLAVVASLCYLYARFIEVDWLKVRRVEIPVQNLPQSFEGFRIVHLSDLHCGASGERERKLPSLVNSLQADALMLSGDFAETEEGEKNRRLRHCPTRGQIRQVGGLGNWDSGYTITTLKSAEIKILLNETDVIEIGDESIGIIGLRFSVASRRNPLPNQRKTIADLRAQLPDRPVVLLEHFPRIIHAAQDEKIDIVLAGHTHGGQVRIPFGPALITPSDMGVWRSRGLFRLKDTYLYINPGVGLEPGPDYMKVRFFCRPEVTLIVLRKAE
ncbi:MAG: metallophosphoesterase [Candidatus Abyssubacteria bacterium]